MTYTPINGMDWTYYTLYKPALADPDSKTLVVHASVDDNSYISEEAKDEILDGLTENEIKIRRHGQYVQVSGLVFREFNPEAHCLDESQLHAFWGDSLLPPQNWEVYWSLDHGLNAPTAIYWHAVAPSGFVITFHEIYRRETLIKDFCDEIHEYERFLGRRPRLRTGDPAIKQRSGITGTSVLQEYAKHGIYIAVDSVPKDPSIGIVRMRQHMRVDPRTGKPRWQLYQCPNLTSELMDLHWERYINRTAERKNPKETVHKFNDHGFDSCKYLFTFMPTLTPEELGEKPKSSIGVGAEGSLSEVLAELDAPPQFNIGGFILLRVGSRETKWSDASLDDEFGFEEHD
jgi:hypothetical protein